MTKHLLKSYQYMNKDIKTKFKTLTKLSTRTVVLRCYSTKHF